MNVFKSLSGALALSLLVVITPWVLVFYGHLSHNPSDWASFGSYIGGTYGSLVAAMALIALLYTIYQQHQQIDYLQNNSRIDRFQASLFQLIDLHRNAIESFTYPCGEHNHNGVVAISCFLDTFKSGGIIFSDKNNQINQGQKNVDPKHTKINLELPLMRKELNFLELIGNILILLNQYQKYLEDEDKKFALNLVHSQISKYELVLFFYYAHSEQSRLIKELVEKFALFEKLDEQCLYDWESELGFFNISAYGDNQALLSGYYQQK